MRAKSFGIVAGVTSAIPFSHQGRMQPGDVIYSLNGKSVESVADLNTMAGALKPGDAAVLQLERSGVLMFIAFRVER